jgi:NADPH:quinone reductase
MRRVRYHAHGGPEVLAIEEAGIPKPGPDQVLIRTEAIGVNYVELALLPFAARHADRGCGRHR